MRYISWNVNYWIIILVWKEKLKVKIWLLEWYKLTPIKRVPTPNFNQLIMLSAP
jgi:hypothetical protein